MSKTNEVRKSFQNEIGPELCIEFKNIIMGWNLSDHFIRERNLLYLRWEKYKPKKQTLYIILFGIQLIYFDRILFC